MNAGLFRTCAEWPRDIGGAVSSHRLPFFHAAARHLRNTAPCPAFSLISLPFCTSARLLPSFVNSSADRAADAALSTLFNPNQPSSTLLPWLNIREAERVLGVDYQEDISEADYQIHKIGGYPTYIQSAPELPGGYAFVLQICSDTTAGFSIGDGGNYYFFYNPRKNDWRVHVDCY